MPIEILHKGVKYTITFPINKIGVLKYTITSHKTLRKWQNEIKVDETYLRAREPFTRHIKQCARNVLKTLRSIK